MPIGESTLYNKDYFSVGGTFSGTADTDYYVEIENDNGTSFKWRKNDGTGWTSFNTANSITLNTSITLTDGLTVKFTRSNLSDYNAGDIWKWRAYNDLKFTSGTDDAYDHLGILERGDEQDLIVINSGTGDVSSIKNYDSSAPVIESSNLNIGSTSSLDMCSRNKEFYLACGKDKNPMWLGYTKNNGFDGQKSDFGLINEVTYSSVNDGSAGGMGLDDFVTIRAGGSNFDNAEILAGIKYNEKKLYIVNIVDSKIYTFNLLGEAIRIRLNPKQLDSSNSTGINGFCVLTAPRNDDYIHCLEFWSVPSTGTIGQGANRDKYVDIEAPDSGTGSFKDFLIIASSKNYSGSSTDFDAVFAQGPSVGTTPSNGFRLLKTEDIDGYTETSGVTSTNYIEITPKLDYTDESSTSNAFIEIWQNQDTYQTSSIDMETSEAIIYNMEDISLAFGGYDDDGANPMIHWTVELYPAHNRGTYYLGDPNRIPVHPSTPEVYGPFWNDGTKNWIIRWVTFSIPLSNTGRVGCAKLLHLLDYNNIEGAWDNYDELFRTNFYTENFTAQNDCTNPPSGYSDWTNIANLDAPPSGFPLYSKWGDGKGRKYFVSSHSTSGVRMTMTYIRTGDPCFVRTFQVPFEDDSDYLWNDPTGLWMFPNKFSTMYTNFSNASTEQSESQPSIVSSKLEVSDGADSRRWNIGDRDTLCDMVAVPNQNDIHNSNEKLFFSAPNDGTGNLVEKLSKASMDATNSITLSNLLGTVSTWLSFSEITDGSGDWVGGAAKSVFYKLAIIYDGYQEGALIDVSVTDSQTDERTSAVEFTIKIDSKYKVPKRATGIAVYRADDDSDTANEPGGLYRFVMEIPLYQFNFDDATNLWEYVVQDDGDTEGSYEAINGLSETMYSLELKYTTCASLNGYMFVGNCSHNEFDDAENYIFRSQIGKYSIFDWSKDFLQLDFVPVALKGFMGKLYVFGKNQMAIVNPESLIIEDSIEGIGCSGPKAIQITPSGLYWFDDSNVYLSSPAIKKIATPILNQSTYGWSNLSTSVKDSAVSGYDSNRQSYVIFFKKSSNNLAWSYYAPQNRWDLWETSDRVYDTVTSSDGYMILLLDEGRICKYLSGSNKRDWEFESKKITFNNDTILKKVKVIKVDASSRANSDIQYKTNDSNSSWNDGVDVSDKYGTNWAGNASKIETANSKVRWLKLRVTGNNDTSGSDVKAYSLGIIYRPKRPK